MKNCLWPVAFALLLSACATHQNSPQTTAESPRAPAGQANQAALEQANQGAADSTLKAIAAAEESVRKADGVGFAWRDSEALITQAKEAAQKQDFPTAEKLANKARQQGDLAYQQYLDQKTAAKR